MPRAVRCGVRRTRDRSRVSARCCADVGRRSRGTDIRSGLPGSCCLPRELPEGPGCFYPPTVLTGIAPDSAIIDSEIFGPVAAIRTFETEDEAVAAANDTEFGPAAYLFTQNLDRVLRVAERLESGMIGINTGLVSNPAAPFGGVKQSGLGREGGRVGIDEFLEYEYLAVPVGA